MEFLEVPINVNCNDAFINCCEDDNQKQKQNEKINNNDKRGSGGGEWMQAVKKTCRNINQYKPSNYSQIKILSSQIFPSFIVIVNNF